jgi:hypothetical protein
LFALKINISYNSNNNKDDSKPLKRFYPRLIDKAIVTETGSSNAEETSQTYSVSGIPFISSGGMMVQIKQGLLPHFRKFQLK